MTTTAVPILLYHSVADDPAPRFERWAVTPTEFDHQMAYLASEGFRSLTLSRFVERVFERGEAAEPRTVVITFDDGFADFSTSALPALERHGLAATLFVTTAYVGRTSEWLAPLGERRRPMLSWSQVRDVHAAGIECGAHTHTHPQLDTLSIAAARREIVVGKHELEEELGAPVTSFAYPHGYHSARVRDEVRRAGFRSACAVGQALATPTEDRFSLSRVVIDRGTDVPALERLLAGDGLPIGAPRSLVRRRAWRAARRAARTARRFGLRSAAA